MAWARVTRQEMDAIRGAPFTVCYRSGCHGIGIALTGLHRVNFQLTLPHKFLFSRHPPPHPSTLPSSVHSFSFPHPCPPITIHHPQLPSSPLYFQMGRK